MLDPTDITLFQLPSPRKVQLIWPQLRKTVRSIPLIEASGICKTQPSIRDVLTHIGNVVHDPQQRYEISAMIPFVYFHLNPTTIMEVGEYTTKLLDKTDIGEKTPTSFFKSPFKQCYIHYTHEAIIGGMHGDQQVAGVYVNAIDRERFFGSPEAAVKLSIDPDKPLRELELYWVGQPSRYAESFLAMNTFKVSLSIQDEEETIEEMLNRHFVYYGAKEEIDTDAFIDSDRQNLKPKEAALLRNLVVSLTKVLLYLNTSGRELRENNALTELKKKKPKGISKMRKLQKRMSQTYDRIVIGPTGNFEDGHQNANDGNDKSRMVHWRRGHFRRHPSDHSRLIRIEPILVNKHKIEGEHNVQTKTYKTK